MREAFARLIDMLGLGRIGLVDDSGGAQLLQVDEGGLPDGSRRILDGVPMVGLYGHVSVPPAGTDAVLGRRAGNRSSTFAIGTNHRASRPKGLPSGTAGLYRVGGMHVLLFADRIEIDAGGQEVLITNASKVRCTCTVETTGDVIAQADAQRISLTALHDAYNQHKHPFVKAGTDTSGPTDHQA